MPAPARHEEREERGERGPTRTVRRTRAGRAVPLIAVVGGCGGAGASTLAVSLATTALGAGLRTVLFDADPLGGGLEQLVASGTVSAGPQQELRDPQVWPHHPTPGRSRRPARWRPEAELTLVSWGGDDGERIPVTAMRTALRQLRERTDLVVVDLPRALDDSAQLVLAEATHTLVVAPVAERAAVAAVRLLPKLAQVGPRPQLVAWLPNRDDLTARQLAELLGLPLAGSVKPQLSQSLSSRGLDRRLGGRSAASLSRFSRRFLERCGLAPAQSGSGTATSAAGVSA